MKIFKATISDELMRRILLAKAGTGLSNDELLSGMVQRCFTYTETHRNDGSMRVQLEWDKDDGLEA
jgi:hypothetical protein